MLVKIPTWNQERFNSTIQKLNKRGLYPKIVDLGTDRMTAVDGRDYLCTAYEIECENLYQVPGWRFIGTLEHTENGNIIRAIDTSVEVPTRYRTAPAECEHCHTSRDRKDTYLVADEAGNVKQVGKSCLKAYTGLNPAVCALAMDIDEILNKLSDTNMAYVGSGRGSWAVEAYDPEAVKRAAYVEVKTNGFKGADFGNDSTSFKIRNMLNNGGYALLLKDDLNAQIADMDAWVESLPESNNFYYNAKLAYKKNNTERRDIGLIAALVNSYFKAKAEESRKEQETTTGLKSNEYVGNIGDKVTFICSAVRALYSTEPYTYGAPSSTVYELLDNDGHTYIYKTTQMLTDKVTSHRDDEWLKPVVGKTISATVKGQKEYKGTKQTVITRAKISD